MLAKKRADEARREVDRSIEFLVLFESRHAFGLGGIAGFPGRGVRGARQRGQRRLAWIRCRAVAQTDSKSSPVSHSGLWPSHSENGSSAVRP